MTAVENGFVIMPGVRLDRSGFDTEFDEARRLIDEVGPCGFIIFGGSVDEVRTLTEKLVAHAGRAMLFAADLERGAGQQFRGLSSIQTPMAIAACEKAEEYAYRAGQLTAREALSVGVNLLFAPVCDVNTERRNPIINVRSFSSDPARVAELVIEWIRGAQESGALACAKHFPGHGATWADSHIELPRGIVEEGELKRHLIPFYSAIGVGVGAIMTGHITVPARGEPETPATLSPHVVRDLLRGAAGYDGLVITDALLMKGLVVAEELAAVKALAAGCDIMLYPTDPRAIGAALDARILELAEPRRRIEDAIRRIVPRRGALSASSTDLSREIGKDSIAPVGSGTPGKPSRFVIHADEERFDVRELRAGLREAGLVETTLDEAGTEETLLAIFSYPAAWREETFPDLEFLGIRIRNVGLVSFGDPYFLGRYPSARFRFAAWDGHPDTQRALCDIVAGRSRAVGRPPVEIDN